VKNQNESVVFVLWWEVSVSLVRSQNSEKRQLNSCLVCLSVRPRAHGTRFSLDRFSSDFIFEYFSKICEKIQLSLKSDKNNEHFQ